jgi:mRNA interferase MazF
MTCRRGDLVLVPFPFTDLSSAKRRPVLVLTEPDGYGDFLAVAVTSRPHHHLAMAVNDNDMEQGKLPVPSWVRTDRIVTLSVALVVKVFGSVTGAHLDRVIYRVCARVAVTAGDARA